MGGRYIIPVCEKCGEKIFTSWGPKTKYCKPCMYKRRIKEDTKRKRAAKARRARGVVR